MVGMLTTRDLRGFLRSLEADACEVDYKPDVGTAVVKDGDATVLKALQNSGGNWIVTYTSSKRISWGR